MAKPKMTKKLAEQLHEVVQLGAPVPSGYVFNPRLDPPLFKKGDAPKRSEIATDGASEVVADPANQPLGSSDDATEDGGDG